MAPRPTHFLCLPLVPRSPVLQNHIGALKHDLRSVPTSDSGTHGLPDSAVRPVGTLHFTLGVMSLDDGNRARAIDVLRGLAGDRDGSGLSLTLKGLKGMGREDATSVLYMEPEHNLALYVLDPFRFTSALPTLKSGERRLHPERKC